jgi:hypothetical protein
VEINRLAQMRPRTVWDIVDDAFDLYRERFMLLFGATAVVYAPVYLVYLGLLAGPLGRAMRPAATDSPDAAIAAFGGLLLAFGVALPLFVPAQVLHSSAMAAIVEDALTDRHITRIVDAYRPVLRRAAPLLLAGVAAGLTVLAASCLPVIGTLYAVTLLAFVPQAILLEGRGIGDAFRRSRDLAGSDWGRVLGAILLIGLISGILTGGLSAILAIAFEMLPKVGDSAARETSEQLLSQTAQSVAGLLLAPLQGITLTLLYYDVRVRREGLDLVAQATEEGYPLAPDPFGDISSEQALRRSRRQAQR